MTGGLNLGPQTKEGEGKMQTGCKTMKTKQKHEKKNQNLKEEN